MFTFNPHLLYMTCMLWKVCNKYNYVAHKNTNIAHKVSNISNELMILQSVAFTSEHLKTVNIWENEHHCLGLNRQTQNTSLKYKWWKCTKVLFLLLVWSNYFVLNVASLLKHAIWLLHLVTCIQCIFLAWYY